MKWGNYEAKLNEENALKSLLNQPFIQFTPQHEAAFICPESAFYRFEAFLKDEKIEVIKTDRQAGEAGEPNKEPFYLIEVSGVDDAKGETLISAFADLLRKQC